MLHNVEASVLHFCIKTKRMKKKRIKKAKRESLSYCIRVCVNADRRGTGERTKGRRSFHPFLPSYFYHFILQVKFIIKWICTNNEFSTLFMEGGHDDRLFSPPLHTRVSFSQNDFATFDILTNMQTPNSCWMILCTGSRYPSSAIVKIF